MSQCYAPEEYTRIRRPIVRECNDEDIEEYEKCDEDCAGNHEWISWFESLQQIHESYGEGSHKDTHKKSHPLPSISENKRCSISPEIYRKEYDPESEKWEEYGCEHIYFRRVISYHPNFQDLSHDPGRLSIQEATRILSQRNTKKNPTRYARNSG